MAMPRSAGSTSLTSLPPMAISPPLMSSSPAIILSKRGLAAAGRADEDDELAVLDVHVGAMDDLEARRSA